VTKSDDRERPTDPISRPPLSAVLHELVLPPNSAVPEPQPDPNSYSHFALGQLLERVRGLEADRGAADGTLEALFEKQTERMAYDFAMIRSSISGLQQSVDALATRTGNTERAVDKLQGLELDMAAMRSQLDRIDREVAVLKAAPRARDPK